MKRQYFFRKEINSNKENTFYHDNEQNITNGKHGESVS